MVPTDEPMAPRFLDVQAEKKWRSVPLLYLAFARHRVPSCSDVDHHGLGISLSGPRCAAVRTTMPGLGHVRACPTVATLARVVHRQKLRWSSLLGG